MLASLMKRVVMTRPTTQMRQFSTQMHAYQPIVFPMQMPTVSEVAEVNTVVDSEDAASIWCIQTYDRKILKMKKHKRQKRKKEMLTKLKWSGKL